MNKAGWDSAGDGAGLWAGGWAPLYKLISQPATWGKGFLAEDDFVVLLQCNAVQTLLNASLGGILAL